jgi:hypothetical protein
MDITYSVTDWFFDRAAVMERAGKMRVKAMSTAGAFTRTKARDLIRRGKKSAEPGKPPKTHTGDPNLETVFFAYDPATGTVVVGSVLLNSSKKLRKADRQTIPELMEQGGQAEIIEFSADNGDTFGPWGTVQKARARGTRIIPRKRVATYAPHPYMQPALDLAMPDVPKELRDLL